MSSKWTNPNIILYLQREIPRRVEQRRVQLIVDHSTEAHNRQQSRAGERTDPRSAMSDGVLRNIVSRKY